MSSKNVLVNPSKKKVQPPYLSFSREAALAAEVRLKFAMELLEGTIDAMFVSDAELRKALRKKKSGCRSSVS